MSARLRGFDDAAEVGCELRDRNAAQPVVGAERDDEHAHVALERAIEARARRPPTFRRATPALTTSNGSAGAGGPAGAGAAGYAAAGADAVARASGCRRTQTMRRTFSLTSS